MDDTLQDIANRWLESVQYDHEDGLELGDNAPQSLRAALGENDLTSKARSYLFVQSLRAIRDQALTYDQVEADPRAYLDDKGAEIFDTWQEMALEHRPEAIEAFALPGMDEDEKAHRAFELVRESVLALTAKALNEQLAESEEITRDT